MAAVRVVVLVEGESDRIALLTLAARRGRDLAGEDVEVVAMGGITNSYAHLQRYRPLGVRLAGLYDVPEEAHLLGALARAGLGAAGFFGCDPDLEYELIRALGTDAVEAVIEGEGEARSLRSLIGMPAQRGWSREQVLHRFLGAGGGRKARYARLLVQACDDDAVPAPLAGLLAVI